MSDVRGMGQTAWDRFSWCHDPGEAAGGYTECSCGWPSKADWDAAGGGPDYVTHLIDAYLEAVQR